MARFSTGESPRKLVSRDILADTRKELRERPKPIRLENGAWWWVWGYIPSKSKHCVLGPYDTYEEADRIGYEKCPGQYEIMQLTTRDETKASRIMRGKYLQDTDIDSAFDSFRHRGKDIGIE